MEASQKPSKSQRKRDMETLQAVGAALVELNPAQLTAIELPEILRDAIVAARDIRDFEGRRRQIQYIGRLMRAVDPAPIRAHLERSRAGPNAHTALQQVAERWRERLLDKETDAWTSFATDYPHGDLQQVRALAASVQRDRVAGRTPKNYRALFRAIRVIVESDNCSN